MDKFGQINIYSGNSVNINRFGPWRSWRFDIGVQFRNKVHFIFQINFSKRYGSIYVNFPYFEFTNGLISKCIFPSGTGPIDLSLEEDAKVTSHLVKYSHPPSGEAHFSQDGKVFSLVRKQSIPILRYNGHFFTCQIQGIHAFKNIELKHNVKPEKHNPVYFILPNAEPPALKFVCMLYDEVEFKHNTIIGEYAACMVTESQTHGSALSFLCSPPKGTPFENKVLIIRCQEVKLLNKKDDAALTFIGGFDEPEIALNPSKETSFLSLLYPISNKNEMEKRLGTIDYKPDCLL